MTWNVVVGDSAPGLGQVLDIQQPDPSYNENKLFSGHNGQVCLIARRTTGLNPQRFCVALWVYREDEPRDPEHFMATFDRAAENWRTIRNKMEGLS